MSPARRMNREWMADAECAKPEYDPNDWFSPSGWRRAVKVCNTCPVMGACLAYRKSLPPVTYGYTGVWGGVPASVLRLDDVPAYPNQSRKVKT